MAGASVNIDVGKGESDRMTSIPKNRVPNRADSDREANRADPKSRRPPTAADAVRLAANGACLYLPPSVLSVPIPLIEVRIHEDALLIWATIQTPFGSRKPLFGLLNFASLTRIPHGVALEGPDGDRLCILADVRALAVPDYTRDKLIKKANEHAQRLKEDEPYRRQWDQHFDTGVGDCVNAGQG